MVKIDYDPFEIAVFPNAFYKAFFYLSWFKKIDDLFTIYHSPVKCFPLWKSIDYPSEFYVKAKQKVSSVPKSSEHA